MFNTHVLALGLVFVTHKASNIFDTPLLEMTFSQVPYLPALASIVGAVSYFQSTPAFCIFPVIKMLQMANSLKSILVFLLQVGLEHWPLY